MNYARLTNVTTGSNRFCKINLAHFTKLFLQHKKQWSSPQALSERICQYFRQIVTMLPLLK